MENIEAEIGKIDVSSRNDAISNYQNYGAVISITDPESSTLKVPEGSNVKQLILEFDDSAGMGRRNVKFVKDEDIQKAVDFAREHKDVPLLIHCSMGERRSPAMAMIIAADRIGPGREDDAIKYILSRYPDTYPNERVLETGDDVLDKQGELALSYYLYKDNEKKKRKESQNIRIFGRK